MDRFENRLRRLYVPKASIALIFGLVIALAAVVYSFSWGVYRFRQSTSGVSAEAATSDVPRGEGIDVGERSFVLEEDRWRQTGLEATEGRFVSEGSVEGRRLLMSEPGLEELLQDERSILLAWKGEILVLGPAPAP